jgi:formylmethanofuran dehydrogenase subunit B
MTRVFQYVACAACGCVCDDLQITVEQNQITGFQPACSLAERWMQQANLTSSSTAWIDDQECELATALDRAAEILQRAQLPLIYGLASSSTPGQRAAIGLAERLGAMIDMAASSCHGPSMMAIQQVGELTCSLGEIKNRADLVI